MSEDHGTTAGNYKYRLELRTIEDERQGVRFLDMNDHSSEQRTWKSCVIVKLVVEPIPLQFFHGLHSSILQDDALIEPMMHRSNDHVKRQLILTNEERSQQTMS